MPASRNVGRRAGYAAAITGGLAALALTNHLMARKAEARYPPRGRFVKVGGVRLHYLEAGEGPAVVLVHGVGVMAEDFALSGLLESQARNGRVIAFDRPGYGYSERPRGRSFTARDQARLLLDAMTALGVERAFVVGHSWGTFVAAHMALFAPDRVTGLALVSGYYRPTPRLDSVALAGPGLPVVGDVQRFTLAPPTARLLTPAILKHLFAPAPVAGRFRREFPIPLTLRPSQLRASAADAGRMVPEAKVLQHLLPGLATPTLVMAGAGDRLIDPAHQSQWAALQAPDATYVSLPGAGHMAHYSADLRLQAEIQGFRARVDAGRTLSAA